MAVRSVTFLSTRPLAPRIKVLCVDQGFPEHPPSPTPRRSRGPPAGTEKVPGEGHGERRDPGRVGVQATWTHRTQGAQSSCSQTLEPEAQAKPHEGESQYHTQGVVTNGTTVSFSGCQQLAQTTAFSPHPSPPALAAGGCLVVHTSGRASPMESLMSKNPG